MDELSANPFVYRAKFEKKDYLIMISMLPVAIVKFILIMPLLLLLFITSFFFYSLKQMFNPIRYTDVKKYYITIPMYIMRLILFLFGLRTKQISHHNGKKKQKANLFILAPHSSMFDVAVLFSLGVTTAVARDEVKNVWVLSKFILLLDPILVKRDSPASRQETIRQIKIRAKYEKIVIFPEGTCTNRSSIIKFRLGAFTPGLPVQPVYLDYEKGTENNTIWCHEGLTAAKLVLLTLFKWETVIRAHLLPVYSPVTEEIEEPTHYGLNVHNYFCDYFNLRRSMYSFEDPKFLALAKNKGVPRSPSCLKLLKMCFKVVSLANTEKTNKQLQKVNPKPIKETSSSQIIALKIKKSSIGSISSMVEHNYNWVEEVETFLRNFVFFSLDKLNAMADLKLEIPSSQSLIAFLELGKKYPGIENSSTFEDFYTTVAGISQKKKMTYLDLYIILTLCNLSTFCLKDRIEKCIMKMENTRKSQLKDHVISYANFCRLIWHLLGIDETYLPESIFKAKKLNSEFFKKEIVTVFRTAVTENAPDLIGVIN